MREIVFDTETTGLDPNQGDRLVEIGAIELINHLPTGNQFHEYINPQRTVPADAVAIHGLDDAFLRDKPLFSQIADKFLAFIGQDSKLVAHNASFDLRFMNTELGREKKSLIDKNRIVDTLVMARERFPGSNNTLDGLCRRFGIDNSNRTLHGALLDSELLAEVYLELIGGRQPGFELTKRGDNSADTQVSSQAGVVAARRKQRPNSLPTLLSDEEMQAHQDFIDKMGENSVWARLISGRKQ